jgi:CBS domain-containing protein
MLCPFCHSENIEGADECANCGHSLAGIGRSGAPRSRAAPDFVHETIARLPKDEAAVVGVLDPLGLAVRAMQTRGINCVLVMDGQRLAGIISGSDILQRVAGRGIDLNAVTCARIMTPDPLSLHDEDTIALALNVMASSNFRHLPVVRDGKPAAIIDVNDVFRFISPHLV